jgi:hypothetical protein
MIQNLQEYYISTHTHKGQLQAKLNSCEAQKSHRSASQKPISNTRPISTPTIHKAWRKQKPPSTNTLITSSSSACSCSQPQLTEEDRKTSSTKNPQKDKTKQNTKPKKKKKQGNSTNLFTNTFLSHPYLRSPFTTTVRASKDNEQSNPRDVTWCTRDDEEEGERTQKQ